MDGAYPFTLSQTSVYWLIYHNENGVDTYPLHNNSAEDAGETLAIEYEDEEETTSVYLLWWNIGKKKFVVEPVHLDWDKIAKEIADWNGEEWDRRVE